MSGNTRFTRDPAAVHKAARAVELRAQGWSYDQIAAEVGYTNKGSAHHAIKNLLDRVEVEAADELRKVERERLRLLIAKAFEVLNAKHPLVSNGKRFDDLQDAAPVIAAIREIRQLSESLRRLDGLDAPSRKVVEVLTEDVVDAAIRELQAEMEALDVPVDSSPDRSGI